MQDGWLDRYADALGVSPLTEEQVGILLDLARDVAHGAERRFAPLSTFLAGTAVAQQATGDRTTALHDAAERARELLSDG